MTEVGDVLATLLISLAYPERVASIAVGVDIAFSFLASLANALTHIMYASGGEEALVFSLPLIAFQPGRLALLPGYVILPNEVMYIVCALSTVLFAMRGVRSNNPWLGTAMSVLVGLFAPLVVVHLVNIILFNINHFLTTSELSEHLFSTPLSGSHYTMAFLSLLIGVVYRGGGQPVLMSFLYQSVGASVGMALIFLLRLFFLLFANVGVVVFAMSAIRAVVSFAQGQIVPVTKVFLALLVIFVSVVALDVAVDAVYDGYTYHFAILQRYSGNPVLGFYINEYTERVQSMLPESRREEFADLVRTQPQDACSSVDSCSELLSKQLASNVLAVTLPAISVALLAAEFAHLLSGFIAPVWRRS